jgi:hypothetical protein
MRYFSLTSGKAKSVDDAQNFNAFIGLFYFNSIIALKQLFSHIQFG